jgi:hypothetical protein
MINNDDYYQLRISENGSFHLSDVDRDIWNYHKNGKPTSFHVRGRPSLEFKGVNLHLLDNISCRFVTLGIKLVNADGLSSLLKSSLEEIYRFNESLILCAQEHKKLTSILDSHNATVPQEKIHQYNKANEL